MFNFIDKFGVELEGAFHVNKKLTTKLKGDGSVFEDGFYDDVFKELKRWKNEDSIENVYRIGEVISKPENKIKKLFKFITKNYPSKVDETCGLHVHLSFKKKSFYSALTHEKFWIDFSKFLRSKKSLCRDKNYNSRVVGENRYCENEFIPFKQIVDINSTKFTQINFKSYRKHKTIENRAFPMFKSKVIARKMVKEYIYFVEKWLSENYKTVIKDTYNLTRVY